MSSEARGLRLLLNTDKELLIVAFACRSISKNGGQARRNDLLESFQDALWARIAGAEKRVHGF